jgi:hypothetical protein
VVNNDRAVVEAEAERIMSAAKIGRAVVDTEAERAAFVERIKPEVIAVLTEPSFGNSLLQARIWRSARKPALEKHE